MYILRLSFCGAAYHGWQIQDDVPTIQGTLHRALLQIFDVSDLPPPSGCGRTDEGVHAVEFLATVRAVKEIAPDNLRMGLNSLLPPDIRVMHVERVPGYRNARTLVAGKHYRYLICRTDTLSPFTEHLVWRVHYPLDIEAMEEGLAHLIGTNDFKSFQASNTEVEETVRTIYNAALQEKGHLVSVDVVGDGFLKHMVRIVVGTLVAVGRRTIRPDDIPAIRDARDRSRAGMTAPGKGLYLFRLFRDEQEIAGYTIPPLSTDFIWQCK